MEQTQRIQTGAEPTVAVGPGAQPPAHGPTVEVECIPGRPFAYSAGRSTANVLTLIRAVSSASGRRPLNLALAVDRSGSMEGDPIAYVKQACSHVVDLLTPSDVLSVVTFEDQVDVVMPARRVVNRDLIKQHISRITTGRTTNLFDGLLTACSQVASVPDGQYLKRVLLLTDGEPTAGIRDFSSIVGLAAEQKAKGIVISALGFGPEYNEELLAGIARRSGGNYYYISRPELIPEVFRRELSTLLSVVALNMRLTLHVPRWVRVRKVYGMHAAVSDRAAQVDLVDLEASASLAVLSELEFDPRPAGPYRVLRAELAYTDAATGQPHTRSADCPVEFIPDPSQVPSEEHPSVRAQLELIRASENLEKTVMGMKTQQISPMTAVLELERTRALLAQQGRTEEAQQLGEAIEHIRSGSSTGAEKTLIGTIYNIERGKS